MSIESGRFNLTESGESGAENIDSYVDQGVDHGLELVKQRFESNDQARDNLAFHNVEHSQGVIRRAELILNTINQADPTVVTNRDVALGRLAAAYHDTVQRWEENRITEGEQTKIMRKRFASDNERDSANEAIAFMDQTNEVEQQTIFSEADKEIMREAVDATVPGWDPAAKTVFQPKLKEEGSMIARAVALADLSTAGIDGPEAFKKEGRQIFIEENLDILDALTKSGLDTLSDTQKEYFRQRMIGWLKSQAGFAQGRQARLEMELQAIPEPARAEIGKLFTQFEASIAAANEVVQQAEAMNFEQLAAYIGYSQESNLSQAA